MEADEGSLVQQFEDQFSILTRLKQIAFVRNYHNQFEKLRSHVGRLSTKHQINCFVNGLKDPLRTDVQATKPSTLTSAMGLACVYESLQLFIEPLRPLHHHP
jgi:hypothetical protein